MSVKVKNNNLIKPKKRVVLTYKLKKPVVLVGMMGAGKTAIGKSLSALLSVNFIDLDEEISEAANMSISEIFSTYGEQFFRDKETKVLNRILNKTSIILATGGGILTQPKNQDIIFAKSHSIFLHSDCKLLWERIKNGKNRPLLNDCECYGDFEQLYRKRETAYKKADITVFNDKNYSINEMAKITVNKYYSFLAAIRESNIDEKC